MVDICTFTPFMVQWCYNLGNNFCMNITAKTKEDPEAVLIRAV